MTETPHMIAHLGPEKTEAVKLALKDAEANGGLICGAWAHGDGKCMFTALLDAFAPMWTEAKMLSPYDCMGEFLGVSPDILRKTLQRYDVPVVWKTAPNGYGKVVRDPEPVTAEYALTYLDYACCLELEKET